jgi:hypothetical protein
MPGDVGALLAIADNEDLPLAHKRGVRPKAGPTSLPSRNSWSTMALNIAGISSAAAIEAR